MINLPQLSMSFATIGGEIVDVNVGLNQVVRQQFSRQNFHLSNYFKTGLQFVGLTWLVVGNNKDFVPSKKQVELRNLLDQFTQLIVISFIHYRYTSLEHIQLKRMHQLVYALYSSTPHIYNQLTYSQSYYALFEQQPCTYEPACQ